MSTSRINLGIPHLGWQLKMATSRLWNFLLTTGGISRWDWGVMRRLSATALNPPPWAVALAGRDLITRRIVPTVHPANTYIALFQDQYATTAMRQSNGICTPVNVGKGQIAANVVMDLISATAAAEPNLMRSMRSG